LWIISQRLDGLEIRTIIEKWPFDRRPPHQSAIYELIKKVKETGSIQDKPGRGGVVTMDTPQNRAAVVEYVQRYRHVSLRDLADELDFSKAFVQRVLAEEKFRAYKIHQVPTLRTCDIEQRFSFAEWYLSLDPRTRSVIWWSDECWFRLEADIITQNCRVWSKTQPHVTVNRPKKTKPVKFWAAICGTGEIVFREVSEKMDAKEYKKMLKNVFPSMKLRRRMFQQDGARIHTANKVRQFLDKKCPAGWIGLGSNKQIWPPYSPDIAPCDFGLWPYLLPRVNRRGASTRTELREFVIEEFNSIPPGVIANICNDMKRRCEILITTKGGNVEHHQIEE
jgi:hypothetical protein